MGKLLRLALYVILGLLLLLVLTNPGIGRFGEFTPDQKTTHHYVLRKRSANFLVLSVFELSSYDRDTKDEAFHFSGTTEFIGIGWNFFEIQPNN